MTCQRRTHLHYWNYVRETKGVEVFGITIFFTQQESVQQSACPRADLVPKRKDYRSSS